MRATKSFRFTPVYRKAHWTVEPGQRWQSTTRSDPPRVVTVKSKDDGTATVEEADGSILVLSCDGLRRRWRLLGAPQREIASPGPGNEAGLR